MAQNRSFWRLLAASGAGDAGQMMIMMMMMMNLPQPSMPGPLETVLQLQTTLQEISSWMTANLLTLNSSKTEFLLILLKQQLAKIQNCPLSTTHSARNLGFIFDEHLSFSDQI